MMQGFDTLAAARNLEEAGSIRVPVEARAGTDRKLGEGKVATKAI